MRETRIYNYKKFSDFHKMHSYSIYNHIFTDRLTYMIIHHHFKIKITNIAKFKRLLDSDDTPFRFLSRNYSSYVYKLKWVSDRFGPIKFSSIPNHGIEDYGMSTQFRDKSSQKMPFKDYV